MSAITELEAVLRGTADADTDGEDIEAFLPERRTVTFDRSPKRQRVGVAPPATPPPSQRSPDAGPRSAPELPARRRGRLDPGADSRFLTWGDDYSPPQSTR